MGSSPIARSIFLFFFLLFFSHPCHLMCQVETDFSRAFDQGQVLETPGFGAYLGDFSQEIKWISHMQPIHTLSGMLALQTGWSNSPIPFFLGSNNGVPDIIFEGISYPFSSGRLLTWFPNVGNIVLLNFPVSSWWGPQAAGGALQIQVPNQDENPENNLSFWSGSGGFWGGEGRYMDPFVSIDVNGQHGFLEKPSSSDSISSIGRISFIKGDSLRIETDFLGSQWFPGDSWYCFQTNFQLKDQNFQSLEVKPYYQIAQLNGQTVQEIGSYLNYLFNLAGLLESHFGFGFSGENSSQVGSSGNQTKVFFQNTEEVDVIGSITANLAFRWDFSSVSPTIFSANLGLESSLNDFNLLGDFSKGVDPTLLQDVYQGELGFRYQPEDDLMLICKGLYEQVGSNSWGGGRFKFQYCRNQTPLFVFQNSSLDIEEEILQNLTGPLVFDSSIHFKCSFFQKDTLGILGREISNQPFYVEAEEDYWLANTLKIYGGVSNLSNIPVAWPDPTFFPGRVFWIGLEKEF